MLRCKNCFEKVQELEPENRMDQDYIYWCPNEDEKLPSEVFDLDTVSFEELKEIVKNHIYELGF